MRRALPVLLFTGALAALAWWMLASDPAADALPSMLGPGGERAAAASAQLGGDGIDEVEADAPGRASLAAAAADAATAGDAGDAAELLVSGRVVDADGAPVAGAQVRVTPRASFSGGISFNDQDAFRERVRAARQLRRETETNEQGEFSVASPGAGVRGIEVRARGYLVLNDSTSKPAGDQLDVGLLTVERGAVVRGRVLDHAGLPVAGAEVTRRDSNRNSIFEDLEFVGAAMFEDPDEDTGPRDGVSDADGVFELAHCRPGEFSLRAKHPDYPPARLDDLSVAAGNTLEGLLLVVDPGAGIRGRVTGLPAEIEGVRVLARAKRAPSTESTNTMVFAVDGSGIFGGDMPVGNRNCEVEPDGSFALEGLAAGKSYQVWAVQTGKGLVQTSSCTAQVEVAAGAQGVELRYDAGIGVQFQVVDARTGAPVEHLWVNKRLRGGQNQLSFFGMAMGGDGKAKQYPDGLVTIAHLRPKPKQTLSLTLEALGYEKLTRDKVELPKQGTLDLGVLRLEPTPTLRVQAVAHDGAPIEGARVQVEQDKQEGGGGSGWSVSSAVIGDGFDMQVLGGGGQGTRTATTGADGWCTLNGFPGQPAVVKVTSEEHAPYQSEPFTQPQREDAEHRARLLQGGAVDVLVLDADAQPVADLRVQHQVDGGPRHTQTTDARGIARFERLVPGEHRFRVSGPGGRSRSPMGDVSVSFGASVRVAGGPGAQQEPGWDSVQVDDGTRQTLQLTQAPTASLAGTVRENGLPLERARVSFLEGRGQPSPADAIAAQVTSRIASLGRASANGRTDGEGHYTLNGVSAGEHRLRITHSDRAMPTVVPVTLGPGANTFDVDLDSAIVRGVVRSANGDPVAGARVRVRAATAAEEGAASSAAYAVMGQFGMSFGGRGRGTRSDADGSFELRGVQTGTPLVVEASAKGFAAAVSAAFEVAENGIQEGVDVQLLGAGTVQIRCSVEMRFAMVSAQWQGEGTISPVSSMLRSGRATLEGLRAGRWKVDINGPGETEFDAQMVDVVAGKTATLDF